jgi:hypothetical protein
MELVVRRVADKTTALRKFTLGLLLIIASCAFIVLHSSQGVSISLFEDDATSVDHVRKLLQTLNPPMPWNSVIAQSPLTPYGANIGQPFVANIPSIQNEIASPQSVNVGSFSQAGIEFLPKNPIATAASVQFSGPQNIARVNVNARSNFALMPAQTNIFAPPQRFPTYTQANSWNAAPPTPPAGVAWPSSLVWPSSAVALSRPALERRDLEEWLRLRQLSSANRATRQLSGPSKSELAAAHAALATSQASRAAAVAALNLKTGAAAEAAAEAAVAAIMDSPAAQAA